MVQSKAKTVKEYLDSLPEEKREVISAVRKIILKSLPKGYEETMRWGMISYEIPLTRYPKTYNKQPLNYVSLASQKNYFSLHLMCIYWDRKSEEGFRAEFKKAGKTLDMGKGCVRFKTLEDLPLPVIGKVIARVSPGEYIVEYERFLKARKK